MTEIKIDIAKDFSKYPSGRVVADGPNSGERFRNEHLIPALRGVGKIIIHLDGVNGYPSSFSEEAFGGLIREGFTAKEILDRLEIKFESNAYETYRDDIIYFIKNSGH